MGGISIATLADILLWILKALGYANNLAERRAGAAESQLEANHAEIDRVGRAARAGAAVTGVRDEPADPYDEAGK